MQGGGEHSVDQSGAIDPPIARQPGERHPPRAFGQVEARRVAVLAPRAPRPLKPAVDHRQAAAGQLEGEQVPDLRVEEPGIALQALADGLGGVDVHRGSHAVHHEHEVLRLVRPADQPLADESPHQGPVARLTEQSPPATGAASAGPGHAGPGRPGLRGPAGATRTTARSPPAAHRRECRARPAGPPVGVTDVAVAHHAPHRRRQLLALGLGQTREPVHQGVFVPRSEEPGQLVDVHPDPRRVMSTASTCLQGPRLPRCLPNHGQVHAVALGRAAYDVLGAAAATYAVSPSSRTAPALDQRAGVAQPRVHGGQPLGVVGQLAVEVRRLRRRRSRPGQPRRAGRAPGVPGPRQSAVGGEPVDLDARLEGEQGSDQVGVVLGVSSARSQSTPPSPENPRLRSGLSDTHDARVVEGRAPTAPPAPRPVVRPQRTHAASARSAAAAPGA